MGFVVGHLIVGFTGGGGTNAIAASLPVRPRRVDGHRVNADFRAKPTARVAAPEAAGRRRASRQISRGNLGVLSRGGKSALRRAWPHDHRFDPER